MPSISQVYAAPQRAAPPSGPVRASAGAEPPRAEGSRERPAELRDEVAISAEARRLLEAEAPEQKRNETSEDDAGEDQAPGDEPPVEPPSLRPLVPPEETPIERAFRESLPGDHATRDA